MMKRIIYLVLFCTTLASIYPAFLFFQRFKQQADVAIFGPIDLADGIGRQTAELAEVLSKKFQVQIVSKNIRSSDLSPFLKKLLKTQYKKPAKVAIVEDSLWVPGASLDRFFKTVVTKDQIRYAYTMLESTQIAPQYVLMINLYFDAIVVPDPFLVDVYQKSGVTVPVFYVPLALNLRDFLQAEIKKPERKKPMVFAALGSGIDRKNHKMMIRAFAKALGNHEDALLFINCRASHPKTKQDIIDEINKSNCSNIKFTEFCLKKDAYLRLLSSIDCLLSFSKGEGFSIQPREAMAMGIPVIVTDNTAQSTIAKSGLVKSIASNLSEPCYYYDGPISDGEYFNCDLDEAAAAIKDMYTNYQIYADKAPLMREWAAAYDFGNLESIYTTLVAPQKVVLGEENKITKDCIITNSKNLYDKYNAIISR